MIFLLIITPSLAAALLAGLVRPYRGFVGWLGASLSLVSLGAALWLASLVVGGLTPTWGLDLAWLNARDILRADSLSTVLLLCITAVTSLALFMSPGLSREPGYDASQLSRYHVFINLFIAAMLLAVSANNVGLMWIAVEATTIFSAFIIPLKVSKASVEASWKYIIICSVGIALAFAGTVLGYFDFVSLSGRAQNALNWTVLLATAPTLHPEVMRLAFVFLLVGYGTKAGLAPMHTWLPDAHSEAPAPLSATLSGVLLAVAMYAILRWKIIADATLGGGYTNTLMIGLGLLSLVIASFSLLLSRNYKRMMAYSSIEHTGLLCLGFALGPLGAFAALLHLLNHSAAKSMLFLLTGRILHAYDSTEIDSVSGLLRSMPYTGGLFAVGILALIGLPPFGLFMSEFALVRAGFATGHAWLMAAILVLLAIAFVGLLNHLNKMLYGARAGEMTVAGHATERLSWRIALLCLNVAVLVVLGLSLPASLAALLQQGARIIAK